jgi:argininosuccinate synthase
MTKEKVVLAYSGGLDTSVILKWLVNKGYDVVAYVADVGQQEDFEKIKEKALRTGASKVYVEDLKEEFVTHYIFPTIKANALYEGRYLLGTAIARPLIAKRQIEITNLEDASWVAHGATGKGNDQVRFELSYYALKPGIKVLSPWKDAEFLGEFKGRPDLLKYAGLHGIPVQATEEKPYSEDENLFHISHESGILEDPALEPTKDVYSRSVDPVDAPDRPTRIMIEFKDGIPVKVENLDDGTAETNPLALFMYLKCTAQGGNSH